MAAVSFLLSSVGVLFLPYQEGFIHATLLNMIAGVNQEEVREAAGKRIMTLE